ncbi:MAG: 1-acyl-sn-glycerol-3-phosphate acyltransferase [Acidobacteria bacterium]|nr:1-acyl-sn-glycerol-3-phosphate acyltransferase [Acidobacteriota bacterium]
MKIAVLGFEGPLAQATRAELARRGHLASEDGADRIIYLPGSLENLKALVERGGFRRLVLRSHSCAYGSNAKNPGLMTEERVSLLPENAPEQRWLRAEQIACRFSNWAAVRLTNVLSTEEGDLLVRQLAGKAAVSLAGRDPSIQFISLKDAARALVAAAESDATGVFNAAGEGTIPLKKALRASGTMRIPLLKAFHFPFGNETIEELEYNWTVSGDRAMRELGFKPELTTIGALAEFVRSKPGARLELLGKPYDEWGLDVDYIRAWGWWFAFLRKVYWRIEFEGMENIPRTGPAMFISNHRGFMPLDAVMHLSLVLTHTGRIIRFIIIPGLLKMPFLCNFLTKLGGVVATQRNVELLFRRGNLVGTFPEGIRGTFTPYKSAYRLRNFSKSAFARMAIENQSPIVPAAVIGHAEIFPIIGRIHWGYVTKEFDWPYFPIAPPFPFLPVVPNPSKWHVRILKPISLAGLKPEDAENDKLVRDLSRYVQDIVQQNINHMLARRKSIYWGRVLDGTAPVIPPFQRAVSPVRA